MYTLNFNFPAGMVYNGLYILQVYYEHIIQIISFYSKTGLTVVLSNFTIMCVSKT